MPKHTPERAIGAAIGRAAQQSCALVSLPVQARASRSTLAEMVELLPDRALILVVENYLGLHGIVALSPGFLSAVIEMQSMGRVFSHAPPERRPTRTDAAICAEFVNAALAELAAELAPLTRAGGPAAFRFASFVEDPKPLELMLEDTVYHSFRLDTRLGWGGAREGSFLAFLPGAEMDLSVTHPADAVAIDKAAPASPGAGRDLSAAMRAAPITLHAILCRKTLSLRDLRALTTGATMALPRDAMSRARLETASGQVVATGKLGALHGNRAIRIAAQAGADMGAAPPSMAGDLAGRDAVAAPDHPGQMPTGPLFAAEPPLGDMADPDAFRRDAAAPDAQAGTTPLPLAPPPRFSVE